MLTQALCAVCAPALADVEAACRRLGSALASEGGVEPRVVSLEPTDLRSVGATFRTVADVCGVPERGVALEADFHARLDQVTRATEGAPRPRVLLLEWLDPPFDGGHWVPGQIRAAGAVPASNTEGGKSRALGWDAVAAADPDVVVVACCGFDLARNASDASRLLATEPRFAHLRAVREGRLFALDGNRYFARPAPSLTVGAAILARCAHDSDSTVRRRLHATGLVPPEGVGWRHIAGAP